MIGIQFGSLEDMLTSPYLRNHGKHRSNELLHTNRAILSRLSQRNKPAKPSRRLPFHCHTSKSRPCPRCRLRSWYHYCGLRQISQRRKDDRYGHLGKCLRQRPMRLAFPKRDQAPVPLRRAISRKGSPFRTIRSTSYSALIPSGTCRRTLASELARGRHRGG